MKTRPKVIVAVVTAVALLGAGGWLVTAVWGKGNPSQAVIDESTKVLAEKWCLACGEYRPVADCQSWQGKNREELQALLAQEAEGARIFAFSREEVTILLPPGFCDACTASLPSQGYIGVSEDNQLAIFSPDGTLFKTYGEAPGAWKASLAEGIPFSSPEDCLDWIINLTS